MPKCHWKLSKRRNLLVMDSLVKFCDQNALLKNSKQSQSRFKNTQDVGWSCQSRFFQKKRTWWEHALVTKFLSLIWQMKIRKEVFATFTYIFFRKIFPITWSLRTLLEIFLHNSVTYSLGYFCWRYIMKIFIFYSHFPIILLQFSDWYLIHNYHHHY